MKAESWLESSRGEKYSGIVGDASCSLKVE
jgi:hypothetical protein